MTRFAYPASTILVAGLLISASSFAQLAGNSAPSAATTFAETITPAHLRKHLTILANDNMEGRETRTCGQEKAATNIAGQMTDLGLTSIVPGAGGKPGYL